MKAGARKRTRPRARRAWFVIGAVLGTVPQLNAEGSQSIPARPAHAIHLDARRVQASLSHIKVWTPSETIPLLTADALNRQDLVQPLVHGDDPAPADASEPQAPQLKFAIAPGPLADALRQFEQVTGLTIRVADDLVRTMTTAGLSGTMTAAQALQRLLEGSGLSFAFADPRTVTIEIRIVSDSVHVTAGQPTVPSPKYSAPLTETPQSIQVIPRALLDEQGATSLTDALRNVPGITMQAGEGGGASSTSGDMFNMRGFSANNSLFVDGVRDDGLLTRDVFNLEQIEVFSGPAGADVGRTNAAGYLNLTSKAPHRAKASTASLSYGAGEQARATADVNQPISLGAPGTFLGNAAVRVNVLWQDGGVAGRDYASRESLAIAPSVAFGLGTSTRATLSGQIMRQDNLADYGLPAVASPVGELTPASPVAPTPVDQTNYYGSPDYDYDHGRQDSAMLRLEHDITPAVTVRNQTRYNNSAREAVITSIANAAAYNPATNLVTLSRQANERHNDIFSNQTNLSARGSLGATRHELSLGVEVARESQSAPGLIGVGTRAPIDLHAPDVFSPVVGMAIAPSGATSEGRTDTLAVYAFDAFDIGPRVRVNGGIRVEAYDTDSYARTVAGVVTDLEGRDTLVSGKAGVLYRLNDLGNVYASVGTSSTPPGSANFQLNAAEGNQNNPNVDPQESTNYEVGTKWDLAGNRLQLSGAWFWTENRNVIFVADATTVPPVFNQDDKQQVSGINLSMVGRITTRLDVNLSVQYLDSEVLSQNPLTNGRRLILAPELSGNVWATYRLPADIRVGGGVRYTDAVFVNAANTIVVPRYALVDGLVEAPIAERVTLRLNIYNATDRVYIRNINNNGGRYNRGTPRSFLLSTAIRF